MKLLFSLFVLTVLVVVSSAQFKDSCHEFCARVRCARPANCDDKELANPGTKFVLKEKASHCACCPMCIQILKEGDACVLGRETGLARLSQCADGLSCIDGKCAKSA